MVRIDFDNLISTSYFQDISGYYIDFRDIVCYTNTSILIRPGQILLYLAFGDRAIVEMSLDAFKDQLETSSSGRCWISMLSIDSIDGAR